MDPERIGTTVRRLRKERKLTQKALGAILHIDSSYVSFIEQGSRTGTNEVPSVSRALQGRIDAWIASDVSLAAPPTLTATPDAPGTIFKHMKFKALHYFIKQGHHVYMWGPASSGKSTAAEQVADELGVVYSYISLNPQTSEFRLLGYKDAGGTYQRTPFRERFEFGGVFCIDELDNANPALLTTINGLLAGGTGDFPDGNIKRHKDFIVVGTGNTNGRGATRAFPDRRKMDAATMDRFTFLAWDIDPLLETCIAQTIHASKGAQIAAWMQRVRAWGAMHAPLLQVTTRATFRMATTIDTQPLTRSEWLDATLFHGLDRDTVITCLRAVPFGTLEK